MSDLRWLTWDSVSKGGQQKEEKHCYNQQVASARIWPSWRDSRGYSTGCPCCVLIASEGNCSLIQLFKWNWRHNKAENMKREFRQSSELSFNSQVQSAQKPHHPPPLSVGAKRKWIVSASLTEKSYCVKTACFISLWFSEPGKQLERARPRVQPERLILTCHCEPGPAGSVGSCGGGLTLRQQKSLSTPRVSPSEAPAGRVAWQDTATRIPTPPHGPAWPLLLGRAIGSQAYTLFSSSPFLLSTRPGFSQSCCPHYWK